MDKKVTGIVAYITLVGWLIAYLAGDKEGAKFQINQALVLFLAGVVCGILSWIPLIGIIAGILSIVVFVFWIMGLVSACQGTEKPVPILGGIHLIK